MKPSLVDYCSVDRKPVEVLGGGKGSRCGCAPAGTAAALTPATAQSPATGTSETYLYRCVIPGVRDCILALSAGILTIQSCNSVYLVCSAFSLKWAIHIPSQTHLSASESRFSLTRSRIVTISHNRSAGRHRRRTNRLPGPEDEKSGQGERNTVLAGCIVQYPYEEQWI